MVQNNQLVWDMLLTDIKNEYGVAGIMGNLQAESCIRSNNLQNTGNNALGVTDEEYTLQIDAGNRDFIDNRGYGIAQWTSSNRKKRLLEYVKNKNKSIGDLESQVEFLLIEMKSYYPSVYKSVVEAKSVKEASDVVLIKYEAPASKNNINTQISRANKGEEFYKEFHRMVNHTDTVVVETIVRKNGVEVERRVINVP